MYVAVFLIVISSCITPGFDVVEGDSYITIEYNEIEDPSVVTLNGDSIKLACKYFISPPNVVSFGDAEWVKVEEDGTFPLNTSTSPSTSPAVPVDPTHMEIILTVTTVGTYSCRYPSQPNVQQTVKVNSGKLAQTQL